MVTFSEEDLKILGQVATRVDEVFTEIRKNIPETKYIFEVKSDAVWFDQDGGQFDAPPVHLRGMWMMSYGTDLRYCDLREAISTYSWVRCEPREVTTIEYVCIA